MRVRNFLVVWMALLSMVVLVLSPVSAQDDASVDTTLFMTFVPNIQFSPAYVALEKGYFADAGFNVTLEYGDEPVGVDLIAVDERQFGIISGDQVIAARANERPVVYVYNWFNQFPVGIVTVDAGIESVENLRGQRVGLPGRFGASYIGLIALLAANGMTESDIVVEEIGFNAPEVICVGAIDSAVVYLNNEPIQITNRALAGDCGDVQGVTVFPVADAVNLVSNGILTSEQMVAENPDQVQAFVAAFDAALRDAIANPAEAYLLSAAYVENLPLSDDLRAALEDAVETQQAYLSENPDVDRETLKAQRDALWETLQADFDLSELQQLQVLLATIDLWDQDQLGYSDPAAWDAMQATLLSMDLIDEPVDLTATFTNDFLPESAGE